MFAHCSLMFPLPWGLPLHLTRSACLVVALRANQWPSGALQNQNSVSWVTSVDKWWQQQAPENINTYQQHSTPNYHKSIQHHSTIIFYNQYHSKTFNSWHFNASHPNRPTTAWRFRREAATSLSMSLNNSRARLTAVASPVRRMKINENQNMHELICQLSLIFVVFVVFVC